MLDCPSSTQTKQPICNYVNFYVEFTGRFPQTSQGPEFHFDLFEPCVSSCTFSERFWNKAKRKLYKFYIVHVIVFKFI